VAGDFFGVLGLRPHMGRLLTPADEASANPAIVLSYSYWENRLGRDPGVLNSRILMNGHPVLVAGVAPEGFRSVVSGQTPDFFVSAVLMPLISPGWKGNDQVDTYWLNLIGRLKPGIDRKKAEAGLLPLFRSVMRDHLQRMTDITADGRAKALAKPLTLEPAALGLNGMRKQWQSPLVMLLVMVGLLLLIACANVASLLLVRAIARQREIALRFALGASRWQVARQLLVESVAIAVAGGLAGLLICDDLARGLLKLLPADATGGWLVARMDFRLAGFSMGVALITGVLFGLAPILRAMKSDLAPALRQQSSGMLDGSHSSRTRQAFVAAQICLSLLLLVGAGLFTRTLVNLVSTDPGFRPDRLVTFSIDPSLSGYSPERSLTIFRDLDARLAALPQTRLVSKAVYQPFGGWNWNTGVKAPGSRKASGEFVSCSENAVGAGYFRTLGTALVRGREFNAGDAVTSPRVAIVNETLARFLFENENPLGRRIRIGGPKEVDAEIVGVVKDAKYNNVREEPRRFLFVPFEQAGSAIALQASYFLRTQADERSAMASIRAVVRQVDPNIPVERVASLRTMIDESIYQDRLIATLAIAFGVLATILSAVGLYGTMSYSTARRTREFGIRLALGADRRMLLGLVMREAGALIVIGVAAGLPLSYGLARLAQSQFYGVKPSDPWTFAGAALLIAAVAVCAALGPSLRSMRIDPNSALRYE
jgi:predicted permease